MNDATHCRNHGLELIEKSFDETKTFGWKMRIMFFFSSITRYDEYGEERTFLVCPKGDYATE